MKKYVVTDTDALRNLCIQNGWFTSGSNSQYSKLFEANYAENGYTIENIALIIWLCSDNFMKEEILAILMKESRKNDIRAAWAGFNKKYPEQLDGLTEEETRNYINDIFELYESFGFLDYFQSTSSALDKYDGQPFTVLGRLPFYDGENDGADLECLPMWNIRFSDGLITGAFPEEICNATLS